MQKKTLKRKLFAGSVLLGVFLPLVFAFSAAPLEIVELRTHTTKDFQHPTDSTKRIKIQSFSLLHYYDGKNFVDLPKLSFPEGKEISGIAERHFVMNLPEWGREELTEDEKILRIYDKKNQPIYVFKNPFAVSKGTQLLPTPALTSSTPAIKVLVDEIQFEIENHKLYLKIPALKNSTYPLQVYDDIDTSSINNADCYLVLHAPNTNFDAADLYVRRNITANYTYHPLYRFTLSNGEGTISTIKFNLYENIVSYITGTISIHRLTQTNWTETGATWNKYNGVNFWATAGGDYDSTPLDSIIPAGSGNWDSYNISSYPSITWGSVVDLLLKPTNETVTLDYVSYFSRHAPSNQPYIEITYTPPEIPECMFFTPEMYNGNIPTIFTDVWHYAEMICTSTELTLIKNTTTGAEFYIGKSISYGDFIIITFLMIFLVFGIVKFLFDFLIPKLIKKL